MSTPTVGQPTVWNDLAEVYELYAEPHTQEFAALAWEAAAVPAGSTVLDVAAGTGALTLLAAAAGARVTAIDFSEAMVARLRRRIDRSDAVVPVHLMDGQQLTFAEASFDAAFSIFGVMLFPSPAAGFAEMARVLRPGGIAATAVWQAAGAAPNLLLARAFEQTFGAAPPPSFPAMMPLTTAAGLTAALAQAGFSDIAIMPASLPWRFESPDWLADRAEPFFATSPAWSALGPEDRERLRARLRSMMRDEEIRAVDSPALIATARKPG